jgi:hypothetical protein
MPGYISRCSSCSCLFYKQTGTGIVSDFAFMPHQPAAADTVQVLQKNTA